MATRANKDTATRFDAMAARANKREQKKAPLLAYAGLVPIHTPDEQREKAERHERMACESERKRNELRKAHNLAAARALASVVDGAQFRTLTAYARHCFPEDLVASVLDRLRREIETGIVPSCFQNDFWREPMEFVFLREYAGGKHIPHRVLKHVDGREEDFGPLCDPNEPAPTKEGSEAAKARMDEWQREWDAGIPARKALAERWRKGERVYWWQQKCGRNSEATQ